MNNKTQDQTIWYTFDHFLLLTCSDSFAFGCQSMMLHSEFVLALIRQVGHVHEWVACTRHIRHVGNFSLNVLVDLRLLRLRCLSICLVIWPVGLPCLAISRFTVDGNLRCSWYRGRGVPRSLQRVWRSDTVDDRLLVVSRKVRHDLLAAPGRAPVSVTREKMRLRESGIAVVFREKQGI